MKNVGQRKKILKIWMITKVGYRHFLGDILRCRIGCTKYESFKCHNLHLHSRAKISSPKSILIMPHVTQEKIKAVICCHPGLIWSIRIIWSFLHVHADSHKAYKRISYCLKLQKYSTDQFKPLWFNLQCHKCQYIGNKSNNH